MIVPYLNFLTPPLFTKALQPKIQQSTIMKFSSPSATIVSLVATIAALHLAAADNSYGTCGDCYCIPDASDACPSTTPNTNWTDIIPVLQQFEWKNPMSLGCNPYDITARQACDTQPKLEKGGACYYDIAPSSNACPTQWSYETKTYSGSFEEAKAAGLMVTHEGACGTCSSMQDLAAYMAAGPDLESMSQHCSSQGVMYGKKAAMKCYKQIGFTDGCANIWYYDGNNTNNHCHNTCVKYAMFGLPNNGPPPTCQIAKCLQCDQDYSGPFFALYGGRTRRNSGMLSSIARTCSSIANMTQANPCESYSTVPDNCNHSTRGLRGIRK